LEFLYLKNELQRAQSSPQRSQSFKIYLCVTLRFTLRSLQLNKKMKFNCVTHNFFTKKKPSFFKKLGFLCRRSQHVKIVKIILLLSPNVFQTYCHEACIHNPSSFRLTLALYLLRLWMLLF